MFSPEAFEPISKLFVFVFLLGPTVCCTECDVLDPTNPTLCSYCPQAVYEQPTPKAVTKCTCQNGDELHCSPTHYLELIFTLMVNQLHHTQRYFKKIEIQECNTDEITTNFFCGLNFQMVALRDCKNLKSFSPHAFSGTAEFLDTLNLDIYSSSPELWNNVFHAIGHLSYLKRLMLTGFVSLAIPSNVFKGLMVPVLPITHINFNYGRDRGNSITAIDNQAFKDLPYLEVIDFTYVTIDHIGDSIFRNDKKIMTDKILSITLTADRLVNTRFNETSFCGSNRTINLILKGNSKPLKLETNFWKSLLDENEQNLIKLTYFTLQCDQELIHKMSWIMDDLDRYKNQIIAFCAEGQEESKLVDKVAGLFMATSQMAFQMG